MYPLRSGPRDQQKYSALVTTSSRRNPSAYGSWANWNNYSRWITCPIEQKNPQSKCKLRPRTRKNPQSLMTNRSTIFGQRNVKDFMDMDNITGNILDTNDFLGIDELIRESKERSERIETANWVGSIKYLLWMQRARCRTWIELSGEWKMRKFYLDLLLKRGCTLKGAIPKCRDTGSVRDSPGWFWTRQERNLPNNQPEAKEAPTTKGTSKYWPAILSMEHIYSANWNIKVLYLISLPSQPEELTLGSTKLFWKCRANTSDDLIIPRPPTPVAVNGPNS